MTVTNHGPSVATGVEITESLTLPADVTVDVFTPSQGTFTDPTWAVGTLASGTSATLTVVLTVGPMAPSGVDIISNTATVTAVDQTDRDPSNNTATEATSVNMKADLRLDKTASTLTPDLGSEMVFTLIVTNDGPSDALGVTIEDMLPAGLVYVSDDSGGAYDAASGAWTVGTLTMGASATLEITARVDVIEPVENTACAAAASPDPDASNNCASVILTPVAADLAVAKNVIDYTADPGQGAEPDSVAATFRVTVNNLGPSTASGVVVEDPVPPGGVLVSSSADQGGYDPTTGQWNVGSLAVGASATLTVTIKAEAGNNLFNRATASSDQPDQNTDNNLAGAAASHDGPDLSGLVADLSVSKAVDNTTPSVGDLVTYTLAVANGGPATTAGVVLAERLPEGLEFVSATVTSEAGQCTTCGYNDSLGVWVVGHLVVGAEARLVLTARVVAEGEIVNRIEVLESHLPDLDAVFGGRRDPDEAEDDEAEAMIVASARAQARSVVQSGESDGGVSRVELAGNYPNPFNPETVIPFALPEAVSVRLSVYNVLGQRVALLVDEELSAGRHRVVWWAGDVPTGVYLVRLEAGAVAKTQRITLMK